MHKIFGGVCLRLAWAGVMTPDLQGRLEGERRELTAPSILWDLCFCFLKLQKTSQVMVVAHK